MKLRAYEDPSVPAGHAVIERGPPSASGERPSMAEVTMGAASLYALRSTCARLTRVGAIVTDLRMTTVLAIGYNGPPRGVANGCSGAAGACGCVHAEANALVKAPYRANARDLLMFATLSPCATCAGLIVNSSVGCVVYDSHYRDAAGLDLLARAGVLCFTLEQFLARELRIISGRIVP